MAWLALGRKHAQRQNRLGSAPRCPQTHFAGVLRPAKGQARIRGAGFRLVEVECGAIVGSCADVDLLMRAALRLPAYARAERGQQQQCGNNCVRGKYTGGAHGTWWLSIRAIIPPVAASDQSL